MRSSHPCEDEKVKPVAALTELESPANASRAGIRLHHRSPGHPDHPRRARQFLQERRIKLIFGEPAGPSPLRQSGLRPDAGQARRQAPAAPGGEQVRSRSVYPQAKPEELTHLRGKLLVPKSHPRIRLRGKLDSLEAYILLAQNHADKEGLTELDRNLGELLDYVRKMAAPRSWTNRCRPSSSSGWMTPS